MYCVYVLRSQITGKIYIGHTSNFDKRLKRHNQELPSKLTSYTRKNKGPWKLVYKEEYRIRKEAMKREKELKSYKGREYIKKQIKIWARSSVGRATAF